MGWAIQANSTKTLYMYLCFICVLQFSSVNMFTVIFCYQKKAVEFIRKIAMSEDKRARHLINAAQFNLGRAYFQGYGVDRQSDVEAER